MDFKKHLKSITLMYYVMAILGIPPISIFLFGDSLRKFFGDNFNLFATISNFNVLIFSLFAFFMVYLTIFHKIILKNGKATVVKNKNAEYYRELIIFLIIAIMLFSVSFKDVLAMISKLF